MYAVATYEYFIGRCYFRPVPLIRLVAHNSSVRSHIKEYIKE
jgi:hypothetical protein